MAIKLPRLAADHPGFFKVVLSLILVHFAMAVDTSFGPRHSPTYRVIDRLLDGQLWVLTLVHVVIAGMLVFGLYVRGRFGFVRYGCALSLVLFNALAVGFALAAYDYELSYYSSIASVTLSLSSLAALKEPPVQSARRE